MLVRKLLNLPAESLVTTFSRSENYLKNLFCSSAANTKKILNGITEGIRSNSETIACI